MELYRHPKGNKHLILNCLQPFILEQQVTVNTAHVGGTQVLFFEVFWLSVRSLGGNVLIEFLFPNVIIPISVREAHLGTLQLQKSLLLVQQVRCAPIA